MPPRETVLIPITHIDGKDALHPDALSSVGHDAQAGIPARMPDIAAIDMNLFRIFLAIWDLRSLTAAGERLGLTQPAVSHALRRLRTLFDDPLFVRTPHTMEPTEAALRLHGPIDQAFGIIGAALQAHRRFDPATARRIFRISMSDMSEFYILPPLLAALDRRAPSIRFEIVQWSTDTVVSALRAGEVDLVLGYVPLLEVGCISERLFSDEHVCLVRAGHPLKGKRVSKAALATLRYVYPSTNATGHSMIEQWLGELGVQRDVILRLPHFTVAPEIIKNTDLAMIFPRSIAERFNQEGSFRLLALPFNLPPIEVKIHTHSRFSNDAGIRWLRDTLLAMFSRPS